MLTLNNNRLQCIQILSQLTNIQCTIYNVVGNQYVCSTHLLYPMNTTCLHDCNTSICINACYFSQVCNVRHYYNDSYELDLISSLMPACVRV